MIKSLSFLGLLLMSGWSLSLWAQAEKPTTDDVHLDHSSTVTTPLSSSTMRETAKMWGLTLPEYQQYLTEMHNTPSAHWWKALDPPHVLGMNAKTEQEREHYAAIDVKLDKQRAERELAFQRAYDRAFTQLYPRAKPIAIATPSHPATSLMQAGDRFYVFTRLNNSDGVMAVARLRQDLQQVSGVSLHIFFTGQVSDDAIRQWAMTNHLPTQLSNGNSITLNHNQRGKDNTLSHIMSGRSVALPVIVRVRAGQSHLLSVLSL